jgi:ribonucleoside-diphosphate reductase beta chain
LQVQVLPDAPIKSIVSQPSGARKNPFPWMSETIDLGKEKNFFETRVTEYQTGGSLAW